MELNQKQEEILKNICKNHNSDIKFTTAICIVRLKARTPIITNVEISKLLGISEVTISKYSPLIKEYFKKLEENSK